MTFTITLGMRKFPNSILLFTDTDYLACEVVGYNLHVGMADIKDKFDFSVYPKYLNI